MTERRRPRRKTKVTTTPAIAQASELRSRRAQLLQKIERLQWSFDKDPDVEGALDLRDLRNQVSELEVGIAEVVERVAIMRQIKEATDMAVMADIEEATALLG